MSDTIKTPEQIEKDKKAEIMKAKRAKNKKERNEHARKHKKPSDRTAASKLGRTRKTAMKPEEREVLRRRLVEYYGATVLDKALKNYNKLKEQEAILVEFRYRMEREIEAKELELADYYKKIDAEYKNVGRPKSVFNWREMEYLCSIGCTLQEIAGFFQVAECTVMERVKDEFGKTFNQYYEEHSQGIKVALRRRQIKLAMDGDGAMLKFLGKNILGQKEKVEFDGAVKVNSWVDLVNNLDAGIGVEITGQEKKDGDK